MTPASTAFTDEDGAATIASVASKTGMKAGKDGYGAFSETTAGIADTKESGRYSKGTISPGGLPATGEPAANRRSIR